MTGDVHGPDHPHDYGFRACNHEARHGAPLPLCCVSNEMLEVHKQFR